MIAIFPSSKPQAVEEEIAKAHKLEFVRRLNTGSAEGGATLYRITDGRAAAEVVAALKGDVRVSAAQENVRYSLAPQAPVPAGVSGARPSATHPRPSTEGQRNASRSDAKPNVSDRASRTAQRLGKARDQVVADSAAILGSGQPSSLVTSKHTALRFPTADEPFVRTAISFFGHRRPQPTPRVHSLDPSRRALDHRSCALARNSWKDINRRRLSSQSASPRHLKL